MISLFIENEHRENPGVVARLWRKSGRNDVYKPDEDRQSSSHAAGG